MKTHASTLLGALTALAVAAIGGAAVASTIDRDFLSHGTANCQSALPVFDGNIRKRPMALANEGAGSAFVTCDTESIDRFGTGFFEVAVYLRNRAGVDDVVVNCTLADGVYIASDFHPKSSVGIDAGGGTQSIVWTTADTGGDVFLAPAISCSLPAGVDISVVEFVRQEEIGA